MIIKTPLLVYLALIESFGIVMIASNGSLPSANLKLNSDDLLILKKSYQYQKNSLDTANSEVWCAEHFHVPEIDFIAIWSASQCQAEWIHSERFNRWQLWWVSEMQTGRECKVWKKLLIQLITTHNEAELQWHWTDVNNQFQCYSMCVSLNSSIFN